MSRPKWQRPHVSNHIPQHRLLVADRHDRADYLDDRYGREPFDPWADSENDTPEPGQSTT